MSNIVLLTHKGWFGLCPIYMEDIDCVPAPLLIERHWLLHPLFVLSEWMYALVFKCCTLLNPEHELTWPIYVTGKLATPISYSFPGEK